MSAFKNKPSPRLPSVGAGRRNLSIRFWRCLPWLSIGWIGYLPQHAYAALEWKQTVHEATVKEGEDEKKMTFAFVNKGESPVTIKSIQPCCGCTTAKLEKRFYKPGEKGEIEVVFKVGDRKGRQEKSIVVKTDDASQRQKVLLLRIDIPTVASSGKQVG